MCYGGLDTKFITADIEARMKGVAFVGQKSEEPGQTKQGGLAVLRRWAELMLRKDDVHV